MTTLTAEKSRFRSQRASGQSSISKTGELSLRDRATTGRSAYASKEVPEEDDLQVYRLAFKLAMDIFETSKDFPQEEKYALTDRIRKSSRTVCVMITEAFSKRSFPESFAVALSSADAENSETQVWLAFALRCGYLTEDGWRKLNEISRGVGRMLHHLMEETQNTWPARGR